MQIYPYTTRSTISKVIDRLPLDESELAGLDQDIKDYGETLKRNAELMGVVNTLSAKLDDASKHIEAGAAALNTNFQHIRDVTDHNLRLKLKATENKKEADYYLARLKESEGRVARLTELDEDNSAAYLKLDLRRAELEKNLAALAEKHQQACLELDVRGNEFIKQASIALSAVKDAAAWKECYSDISRRLVDTVSLLHDSRKEATHCDRSARETINEILMELNIANREYKDVKAENSKLDGNYANLSEQYQKMRQMHADVYRDRANVVNLLQETRRERAELSTENADMKFEIEMMKKLLAQEAK